MSSVCKALCREYKMVKDGHCSKGAHLGWGMELLIALPRLCLGGPSQRAVQYLLVCRTPVLASPEDMKVQVPLSPLPRSPRLLHPLDSWVSSV